MSKKLAHILVPSSVLASLLLFTFLAKFYETGGMNELIRTKAGNYQGGSSSAPAQSVEDSRIQQIQQNSGLNGDIKTDNISGSGSIFEEWRGKNLPWDGSVIVIQPVLPVLSEGEKVIRTGAVNLEVEDGRQTYRSVSLICEELGGYLANSDFNKNDSGRESGTITLRIPKDNFKTAMERFGALGKVKEINTESKDVSREYSGLKSQLDIAMVLYNKMFDALQRKQNTISDALRLESELTPVLKRIEELKNKLEYLNKASAMATITVSFYEKEVSLKALKESTANIRLSMISAAITIIKMLPAIIPIILVVGIVVLVLIALVLFIKDWVLRRFKSE